MVYQAIDGANGFQNTHQIQQYESAKFGLDQVKIYLFLSFSLYTYNYELIEENLCDLLLEEPESYYNVKIIAFFVPSYYHVALSLNLATVGNFSLVLLKGIDSLLFYVT